MKTPRYGLDISSNMHDTYQKGGDFTVNGQCSRCGACCTHHLMVTKKEQQQIKAYIKQHHIQPIRHGNPDEQRFQNRRHEVFLTHTKDSSKDMWFDIMGLTKVDIL